MAQQQIPQGATCVERIVVKRSDAADVEVTVARYAGQASDGYKSGYERRDAQWLLWVRRERGRVTVRNTRRYAGSNLARAVKDYTESADALRECVRDGQATIVSDYLVLAPAGQL